MAMGLVLGLVCRRFIHHQGASTGRAQSSSPIHSDDRCEPKDGRHDDYYPGDDPSLVRSLLKICDTRTELAMFGAVTVPSGASDDSSSPMRTVNLASTAVSLYQLFDSSDAASTPDLLERTHVVLSGLGRRKKATGSMRDTDLFWAYTQAGEILVDARLRRIWDEYLEGPIQCLQRGGVLERPIQGTDGERRGRADPGGATGHGALLDLFFWPLRRGDTSSRDGAWTARSSTWNRPQADGCVDPVQICEDAAHFYQQCILAPGVE